MINFAEARKNVGYSLEAVSELVGISVSALEFYEQNQDEITLSDAVMLSELYRSKMECHCFCLQLK